MLTHKTKHLRILRALTTDQTISENYASKKPETGLSSAVSTMCTNIYVWTLDQRAHLDLPFHQNL